MDIKQAFMLTIKSLMASKMRSFLTMLGIIIGVASVIVLVSLVNGMTLEMMETFENMGTNLVSVSIRGRGGNRMVTPEQMQELVDEHPDVIAGMTPIFNVMGTTANYESNSTKMFGKLLQVILIFVFSSTHSHI